MSEVENLGGKSVGSMETVMQTTWRYGGMPILPPRSFETILSTIFLFLQGISLA